MDTWELTDEEMNSVLAECMERTFDYFVGKVADWGQVWVLAKPPHELAMIESDRPALAVWPHQRYAEACRVRNWADYEPHFVELDNFLEATLPEAEEQGHIIAILHSAETQRHVTVPPDELRQVLEQH
ncbi:DUF2750 domain-containing protein [Solirubrobacter sp. CPCC 204708]|uniref:DUF2750 domain-containing protein n=1 Tax=Solirubrobacter deserti TaxID=2282478 RepID=A0ABT4RG18_9ACTN|nr:DUF2750 domain-containing protein [Solirubrobacter deserti]MBE2318206.1 DUF2750 domain-containing protein [Solirubrobacter deserti]MDA0137487.1 DUF2750 domain-containing protein [Solirubrobacter deserti]